MQRGDATSGKRLEEAQREIARWRRRSRGVGRMPHELWRMAAEAAVCCGPDTAAARLQLDAARLKQWIDRLGLEELAEKPPMFVELPPLTAGCPPECTLEWEEPSGRKIRISFKGQATDQLLPLGQMLWRNQA